MKKSILSIIMAFAAVLLANAQENKGGIAFGTSWGFAQLEQLDAAVAAEPSAKSYVIDGFTITPDTAGNILVDMEKKNFRKPLTISFTAAEDGNACLKMRVKVAKGKRITVYCGKKRVKDSRLMDNSDGEKAMVGTFDINIPEVKAGDVISVESSYTDYNCFYSIAWNRI